MKLLLTICLCLLAGGVMAGSEAENVDAVASPDNWTNQGGASKIASVTDATDDNYVYSSTADQEQKFTISNPSTEPTAGTIDSVIVVVRHIRSGATTYSLTLGDGAATSVVTGISPTANETWENYTAKFLGLGWSVANVDNYYLTFKLLTGFAGVTKVTSVTYYWTWGWVNFTVDASHDCDPNPFAFTATGIEDAAGEVGYLGVSVENSGGQHFDSVKIGGLGGNKLTLAGSAQEVEASLSVELWYADSADLAGTNDSLVLFADRTSASNMILGWIVKKGLDQDSLFLDSASASNTTNPCTAVSCTLTVGTTNYNITATPVGALTSCLRQAVVAAAFKINGSDSLYIVGAAGHGNNNSGGNGFTWTSATPTITERYDVVYGSTVVGSAADSRIAFLIGGGQVIIVQ